YVKLVVPWKLGSGWNVTPVPPGAIAAVPSLGWVTAVTVSVSPSMSLSLTSTSIGVSASSSATLAVSFAATGGSLTGVTVIATVAVAVPPWPSEIVYVKLVAPWKFAAGWNATLRPSMAITAEPFAGWVTAVIVRALPSMSLSLTSTSTDVGSESSAMLAASSTGTGAWLIGVTVMLTVAVAVPPLPS